MGARYFSKRIFNRGSNSYPVISVLKSEMILKAGDERYQGLNIKDKYSVYTINISVKSHKSLIKLTKFPVCNPPWNMFKSNQIILINVCSIPSLNQGIRYKIYVVM